MEEVFAFFLFVLFFGVIAAIVYKFRYEIKRFIKDPKYGSSWQPSRKTILQRRIEDANDELNWLEAKETETGG